jgi:hypothetical protein
VACYTQSKVTLDHPYIDEHNLAERFVGGQLSPRERKLFEKHYVDCQECMDRVALAQIFQAEAPAPQKIGPFTALATFTPRQQTLIFALSTLALLLMPVIAINWFEQRQPTPQPQAEPVIWLPPSGAVEAHIPASAAWVTFSKAIEDQQGTYRISIVDVAGRPIVTGPDQRASKGTALGLRLAALPPEVNFIVFEKKAENGAYTIVSRHPLIIQWR